MISQIDLQESVYIVTSSAEGNDHFGTAFAFQQDNEWTYFLAAAHTIDKVGIESILLNKQPAEVVAIGKEDEVDLAVLKIRAEIKIPLLSLKKGHTEVGTKCLVIGCQVLTGNLFRLKLQTGKLGNFSPIQNRGTTVRIAAWNISQEFNIEDGNSGGPLIDENDGKVVGIVIKKAYAIACGELRKILKDDNKNLISSEAHIQTLERPILTGIMASELLDRIRHSFKGSAFLYPYPGFRLKHQEQIRPGNYLGVEQIRFLSTTHNLLNLVFENQRMLLDSLPFIVYIIARDAFNNIGNEQPVLVPVVLDLPTEGTINNYSWPRSIMSALTSIEDQIYRESLVTEILQPNSLGVKFLLIIKVHGTPGFNRHMLLDLINWSQMQGDLKVLVWIATTTDSYQAAREVFDQFFPTQLELSPVTGDLVIPAKRMPAFMYIKQLDDTVRLALTHLSTIAMPLGERSRGTTWRKRDIEAELAKSGIISLENGDEKSLERLFEDGNLQLLEDDRVIFGLSWGPEIFLAYKLFLRDSEVAQLLPREDHNFDMVALYLASLGDKYYEDILWKALQTGNIWLATKCLIFNEPPYVSETIRRIVSVRGYS